MATFTLYRGKANPTPIYQFNVAQTPADGFVLIRTNSDQTIAAQAPLAGTVADPAAFEFKILAEELERYVFAWNYSGEGAGKLTTSFKFRANGWEPCGFVTLDPPIGGAPVEEPPVEEPPLEEPPVEEPPSVDGMGPLVVSAANPRYFAKPDGTPLYLTGSHIWNNLVDSSQPGTFDFAAYLDWMVANKFNFVRLWAGLGAPWHEVGPSPYIKLGDGRYDLTQLNQAYFDRIRSRCVAAAAKGIYVDVMMWNDWAIRGKDGGHFPWPHHPFNAANNINGINGDPSGSGDGGSVSTLAVPAITDLQKAYIEKVVDTVGDLDNVLYEITNESHGGSENIAWQEAMIAHIHAYQAGKPKQHPVGFTSPWPGGSNAALFASGADWISPNGDGGYMNNPPAADGSKVVIVDTDHVFGLGGDAAFIWRQFLRGHSAIVMDNLVGTGIAGDWPEINSFDTSSSRRGMTQTAHYACLIDLKKATPQGAISSSGYCLAEAGKAYLALGADMLILDLAPGTFAVEWLNISSGAVTADGTVTGGISHSFVPPAGGDHILYLAKVADEEPPVEEPPVEEPPVEEPPVGELPDIIEAGAAGSASVVPSIAWDSKGRLTSVVEVPITHPEGGGKSAYQIWLDLGNTGSQADFINSLKGPKGDPGEDASGGGGINITIEGGSLPRPTNFADAQALFQACASEGRMCVLSPDTSLVVDQSFVIEQPKGTNTQWGIDFNGAAVRSSVGGGQPVFVFKTKFRDPITPVRGFTLKNGTIIGNPACGPCVYIWPENGASPFYVALLENMYLSEAGCKEWAGSPLADRGADIGALTIQGAAFELMVRDFRIENCMGHGMSIVNMPQIDGGNHPSNIMISGLNSSRNDGAALYSEHSSFDLVQFSSVLNGQGIAICPTGFRLIADGNGEMTGKFGIVSAGFGSLRNVEVTGTGSIKHGFLNAGAACRQHGNEGIAVAVIKHTAFSSWASDLRIQGHTQFTNNGAPESFLAEVNGGRVFIEPWHDRSRVRGNAEVIQ